MHIFTTFRFNQYSPIKTWMNIVSEFVSHVNKLLIECVEICQWILRILFMAFDLNYYLNLKIVVNLTNFAEDNTAGETYTVCLSRSWLPLLQTVFFLLCICSHSLFMWDLMLTIVISSVWSQSSLIPKLCYGSSLQPEGNVLLCCMNTWNNGAPRKSPHFIVCSFYWVGL